LFAGELVTMYRKYAETNGWQYESLSFTTSDVGGIKVWQLDCIRSINTNS